MWFVILAVVIGASVVFDIVKGRIHGRRGHIYRSETPFLFWFIITLKTVFVLFVAFPTQAMSLVQYGIEDTSAETQRKVREFQEQDVRNK